MTRAERKTLMSTTASLAAAVDLLERGGRVAAPSNKMFALMLKDYNAALTRAREALALPPDPVPRRLTAEDVAALFDRRVWPGDSGSADFLNARIFGEQK